MSRHRQPVIALLDSYCRSDPTDAPPVSLTDHEVEHLYESGLASITICGIGSGQVDVSEKSARLLRSADLTARVLHAQKCHSVVEILVVANRHNIPIVLLKGISIAEDLYAEPHHRIMGDVDVLAPVEHAGNLQDLLCENGYRVPTYPDGITLREGHHHLPELRNSEGDVAVEIHTSLFSASLLSEEPLFQITTIWSHVKPATFRGYHCLEFRPEFRLLYTVAHWAIDQKWTTNVISINDVILMLRTEDVPMDWRLIATWLSDGRLLREYLTVILLFLKNEGIVDIPTELSVPVDRSARRIGVVNMKILHWLILSFPLSDGSRNRSEITHIIVRIVWQTMLEPRHKSLRLIVALSRIVFRRTRDRSLLSSVANRIRTFFELARR